MFVTLFLGCQLTLSSQNELVSFYNSYSQVYGGMEDSGISRNESYYFQVNKSITLKDIYLDGEKLNLKKGDTLIIHVGTYIPYNSGFPSPTDSTELFIPEKPKEIPAKDRYQIYQQGRKFYANLQYPYIWDKTISYSCKKKNHTAKAKEGFDAGHTDAAP
ncbi:MAG: hypothetical protein IPM77_07695 [Crocinitomicaceae bacterium]|nr:hypothetical protein [Crocinitomicaceae bacterium]